MALPFVSGIGGPELIIILVVVLVIFGPKQLPKLGKMFGKTMREVRSGMENMNDDDDVAEAPTKVVEVPVETPKKSDDA